jgi:putative glutamine amidotransferase
MSVGKPRIGITTGTVPEWQTDGKYYLPYARAITDVGGIPVALGVDKPGRLEDCSGILITGGDDVHPRHYKPRPGDEHLSFEELKTKYSMKYVEPRDAHELPLVKQLLKTDIPILGICRGFQIINVLLGGGLVPDIPTCIGRKIVHSSGKEGVPACHKVSIEPNSRLGQLLPGPMFEVNSYHHQGLLIEDIAPELKVVAMAPDGMVESIEGLNHPWLVAVQWHPERLQDESVHEACKPIFKELINRAS